MLTKTRELLSIINEKAPLAIARIIECANIAAGDGIAYSGNDSSNDNSNDNGNDAAWEPDPFGGDARPDDRTADHTHTRAHSAAPAETTEPTGDADTTVTNGFLREQEAFGECFATLDMQEGANAFLAKRKPHFTGK